MDMTEDTKALRAIVFGGSGFLGSHVADVLHERGMQVRVFDRLPSPYLQAGQEMVLGDIQDQPMVEASVQGHDVVYNFAGIADLGEANDHVLESIQSNVLGNTILLEAARKAGVQRFLYASTIYVYSELGGFYRCGKQAAELYIEEYQRRYGLDYTILRYGSLYGPRADKRNSIHRYLTQALLEGHITCLGTGDEEREYINVHDAARLSVDVLAPPYRNRHVVLTGQYPMQTRQMLRMLQEIMGGRVEVEYQPAQPSPDHYGVTPYSFIPRVARKIVSHEYMDMGQGLLECLYELHREMNSNSLPESEARSKGESSQPSATNRR